MELLIGCGGKRDKLLSFTATGKEWSELVTLDINPDHRPDVVWDLSEMPLPFAADSFDEIHAYEVLEHVGVQGDWRFFFRQWEDFWRILKPGGVVFAICPDWRSAWAWGDPGHTRIISEESLTYLVRPEYDAQVGSTAMTDYRRWCAADFDKIYAQSDGASFRFAMRAVKPARIA